MLAYKKIKPAFVLYFGFICLISIISGSEAGQVDAYWTGSVSTSYWDERNWDIGVIPFNDIWDDYNVYINAAATVDYDFDYPIDIERFYLSEGKTFNLKPGSDIAIKSAGIFNGNLTADNALFIAGPAGDYLITGTKATFAVKNGGKIALPALEYSAVGLNQRVNWDGTQYNLDLFVAEGAGSVLDLSSLTRVNDGFNDESDYIFAHKIRTAGGGKVDLSNVYELVGPYRPEDRLDLIVDGASEIDLSNLQTVRSAYRGRVRFQSTISKDWSFPKLTDVSCGQFMSKGGDWAFPQLTSMTNSSMNMAGGGRFIAPNLTNYTGTYSNWSILDINPTWTLETNGLTNITGTQISVSGGQMWGTSTGDILSSEYSAVGLNQRVNWDGTQYNLDLFVAEGAGSVLDLSSLTRVNDGFNDESDYIFAHKIRTAGGGKVDLSNVYELVGPYRPEDRLDLIVDGASEIDLSSLQTVRSAYRGRVRFQSTISKDWSFPKLTDVSCGQFMSKGGDWAFPQLTSMTNSSMNMAGGGRFIAPNLTNYTGTYSNWSILDINPTWTLETNGLTNITGTQISVSGGQMWGTSTGDILSSEYSAVGLNQRVNWDGTQYNLDLFVAEGAGSVLDLSSLTRVNDGFNDDSGNIFAHKIRTAGGGKVDLSNVYELVGPYQPEDRLDLIVDGASEIDLSSLQTVRSAYRGRVRFVADNGQLVFNNISSFAYTDINLTGFYGKMDVKHDFLYKAGSTIATTDSPTVAVAGSYLFNHTAESQIQLENGKLFLCGSLSAGSVSAASEPNTMLLASSDADLNRVYAASDSTEESLSGAMATYARLSADESFADIAESFLDVVNTAKSQMTHQAALPAVESLDESVSSAGTAGTSGTDLSDVMQYLEVGSLDGGLTGALTGNFAIGQLIVGQNTQQTMVYLMDTADNGNRGTAGVECLYLSGFGSEDGLKIYGGSTLVLNKINIYARIGFQMVHVNSLIPAGQIRVAFGGGYISLTPEMGDDGCGSGNLPYPAGDINQDCSVNMDDLTMFVNNWLNETCLGPEWCDGTDLTRDGVVNMSELEIISANWLEIVE